MSVHSAYTVFQSSLQHLLGVRLRRTQQISSSCRVVFAQEFSSSPARVNVHGVMNWPAQPVAVGAGECEHKISFVPLL